MVNSVVVTRWWLGCPCQADRAHTGEGHATDATGGLNLEARRKRKFDLKLAVHGVQVCGGCALGVSEGESRWCG